MTPALVLLLLLLMGGCAHEPPPPPPPQPERYLTQEQDERWREQCAQDGCVVVPESVYEEMVRRMHQFGVLLLSPVRRG
jgi:hypothetical protein